MARPIWKGTISFGLVNIPIVLYGAENPSELHFTLLDSRNKARVRYERVNEVTGKEVPWEQIVKGYEYESGNYVLLGDEDFKRAAAEATQTVEIEDFVSRDELDPVYFEKPYYVVPMKAGEKGYVLLREVLRRTKRVGIAKVVIRTRQYLAALLPEDDMLVLNVLRFADEIRSPDELGLPTSLKASKVSAKEVELAEQLVDAMTSKWEPEKYHDEYRDRLMEWINQKVESGDLAVAPPAPESRHEAAPAPINIMDLLKKSVQGRDKPVRKPAARSRSKSARSQTRKKAG